MNPDELLRMQFCGFGGQGIILLSVLFGTAAVTRAGMNAVQTQSFGSEARGGACQSELILSKRVIHSPMSDQVDILVAMSQEATDKYLGRLKTGGALIIDADLVESPARDDIQIIHVPATRIADEMGQKIAANMVILGFLHAMTGLFAKEDLLAVIREHVSERFLDVDIKAAEKGISLAKGVTLGR